MSARSDRESLITDHIDYVRKLVKFVMNKHGIPYERFDDLVSAAMVGLIDSAERYDPTAGHEFSAFAYLRVRGSIFDEIRKNYAPKGYRIRGFRAALAAHELRMAELEQEQSGLKKATTENPKAELDKIFKFAAKAAAAAQICTLSFEDHHSQYLDNDSNLTPEQALEFKEKQQLLKRILPKLTDMEQRIIEGFYFDNRSLAEIATKCGNKSRSWACRVHARAIEKLKKYLENEKYDFED